MANYFAVEGIVQLEEYYVKRAIEEYHHHDWIRTRLSEADFSYKYPAVPQVKNDWPNNIQPFKDTVLKEIETTEKIDRIAKVAMEEGDYQTFTWLQSKLIPEQHEEESTSRTALDIMNQEDASIFKKAEEVYELLEK